jgi:hypothetical protein
LKTGGEQGQVPDASEQSPLKESVEKPLSDNQDKKGVPRIAGAGGGTLLVLLAQSLRSPWNSLLLYAAPALSIAASAVFTPMWQDWLRKQPQRGFARALKRAKRKLRRLLRNKQTSEEHKQKLRLDLEKIENIEVSVQKDLIVEFVSVVRSVDKEQVRSLTAHASSSQSSAERKS